MKSDTLASISVGFCPWISLPWDRLPNRLPCWLYALLLVIRLVCDELDGVDVAVKIAECRTLFMRSSYRRRALVQAWLH
jgi:hypothetical protein